VCFSDVSLKVPLSAGAVAAKEVSHSPPVQLNTSLPALSPKRRPTSALFYQAFTAPLLAPHACGKKTLHVSLWVRIPSIAIAAVTLMSEIPSIAIAAVTSMWNFIFSASEYVPAKSSYTSVGVPLISPTPWPIACLSLLFISMSPSCMEHAALTGLSPTRVPRSSCPFFGFPVPPLLCLGTEIFCCFWFPLLDYFPFFDMIFVAQPRHAFACARGKGKTGVTVTVTRLSLGCLILFLPLI